MERGAPGRGLKVVRAFTNLGGGEGGSWNLMLSLNLLKSKIPMLRGRLTEFDAEFKFTKIQNSHVEGGGGGGRGSRNLMLSSNLLKSKIPMLRVGGGGGACGI